MSSAISNLAIGNMASKKKHQAFHARSSFSDRYGIVLTDELHARFVKDIQTGKAFFMFRQSHRVSVFKISHEGRKIPVVYDGDRKQIVTALPPECLKSANIGVYLSHLQE